MTSGDRYIISWKRVFVCSEYQLSFRSYESLIKALPFSPLLSRSFSRVWTNSIVEVLLLLLLFYLTDNTDNTLKQRRAKQVNINKMLREQGLTSLRRGQFLEIQMFWAPLCATVYILLQRLTIHHSPFHRLKQKYRVFRTTHLPTSLGEPEQ